MFSFINAIVLFLLVHRLLRTSVHSQYVFRTPWRALGAVITSGSTRFSCQMTSQRCSWRTWPVVHRNSSRSHNSTRLPSTVSLSGFRTMPGFIVQCHHKNVCPPLPLVRYLLRNIHHVCLFYCVLAEMILKFIFDFFKFKAGLLITMMVVLSRCYKKHLWAFCCYYVVHSTLYYSAR